MPERKFKKGDEVKVISPQQGGLFDVDKAYLVWEDEEDDTFVVLLLANDGTPHYLFTHKVVLYEHDDHSSKNVCKCSITDLMIQGGRCGYLTNYRGRL